MFRNQTTAPAVSAATRNWTTKSRPTRAREKAAMPRGVRGCQAGGRGRTSSGESRTSAGGALDSSWDIRHRSLGRRRWRAALALTGRRNMDDVDRVADFHDVVHEHLDVVRASRCELDIAKEGDGRGREVRVFHLEFHLALAQHRAQVGREEAKTFREDPDAGSPAVEEAQPGGGDRELRDADDVNDAQEEEVAVG